MLAPRSLSRRCFLGAALAAAASTAAPVHAIGRPVWLENLAANAFGIRSHLIADFAGTLERLRRIGFRRLELVSFKGWDGHPYGSFSELSGMSAEAVATALKAADLTSTSSHVLPKEVTPEALPRTLQWMEPIGVNTLVMAGLPVSGGHDPDIIRSIEDLNETGRRISDQGFRLMLHSDFTLWQSHGSERYFEEFLRRVDPACCKLQLDLGAALQMSVDARQVIRQHGRHLGSLHLRDGMPPFNPKVYVPSVPLGEGTAPIRDIVQSAVQAGIQDFVLEMVMRPEGREMDALARSFAFLVNLQQGMFK